MNRGWLAGPTALVVLLVQASAWAANEDVEKLLPHKPMVWPWIAAVLVIAGVLVCAFKSPGRTHLD